MKGRLVIGLLVATVALLLTWKFSQYTERPAALLQASADGDSALADTLLRRGTSPMVRDGWQSTPLMYAAGNGHLGTVTLLLSRGADVNEPSRGGRTPLMWAAASGRDDIVRVLLDAGASPSVVDPKGKTALTYAAPGLSEGTLARLRAR